MPETAGMPTRSYLWRFALSAVFIIASCVAPFNAAGPSPYDSPLRVVGAYREPLTRAEIRAIAEYSPLRVGGEPCTLARPCEPFVERVWIPVVSR